MTKFGKVFRVICIVILSYLIPFLPGSHAGQANGGYWVAGTAYDTSQGYQPLEGVTITASNGLSAITDAKGYFRIEGFDAGTYTFTATKEHYSFPQKTTVTVNMSACCIFFQGYPALYSLGGKVQNDSQQPFPGVLIRVKGSKIEQTTVTDEFGGYYINNLPFGEYTVTASIDGYFFSPNPITVKLSSDQLRTDFHGFVIRQQLFLPFAKR